MSEVDWNDLRDSGGLVVPAQAAIAVYTNQNGHVVVRAQGERCPDEDHWIVIDPKNVVAVVYAMLDAAGLDAEIIGRVGNGYVDIPRPNRRCTEDAGGEAPKYPTAAERQRPGATDSADLFVDREPAQEPAS